MKVIKDKILLVIIFVFSTSMVSQTKFPDKYSPNRNYKGQSVFDIVNVPEENIDIGLWALIVAKEFDNSIDVNHYLNILDEMAMEVNRMLSGREKDMDKFLATKMFLYNSGKWNNNNPFSYDLEDPLGNNLQHKLLNHYIVSRKGNCVSMPTLFLAIMERIDPNIKFVGVKAPLHLFCRLIDRQTNDIWNVETTNGGNPARNQWYIETMGITQKALDNKLYLRDLTKKEFIAELIGTLISKERRKDHFEKAMEYTDLAIELSPNSDLGLVSKGALFAEIAYAKSQSGELSEDDKKFYDKEADKYIAQARKLGWKYRTSEEDKKYLESVKTELNRKETEAKR